MKAVFEINPSEKKAAFGLALIFGTRMLGLFMILPIFSLYLSHFVGATPALMGLVLGIYGLSSGVFQLLFGAFSDRWGRKKIITVGLLIFILGSLVAAHAQTITGVMIGRALQGVGAIGSSVLALLADLTRPEVRIRAMSLMGMTIGLSFVAAMMAGPWLAQHFGLSGIFDFTAVLGVLAIALLWGVIPQPEQSHFHPDQEMAWSKVGDLLRQTDLMKLNFGVFILHAVLTATFVVMPLILVKELGVSLEGQSWVYAGVLPLSFLIMLPGVILAEKRRRLRTYLGIGISGLALSEVLILVFHSSVVAMIIALILFFAAFTLLEALLPSWVARVAPLPARGSAMGLFSSSQFFGAFFGGAAAGYLYSTYGYLSVVLACIGVALLWGGVAATMPRPLHLSTRLISFHETDLARKDELQSSLLAIPGVGVAEVSMNEQVAYLKVDTQQLKEEDLAKWQKVH